MVAIEPALRPVAAVPDRENSWDRGFRLRQHLREGYHAVKIL